MIDQLAQPVHLLPVSPAASWYTWDLLRLCWAGSIPFGIIQPFSGTFKVASYEKGRVTKSYYIDLIVAITTNLLPPLESILGFPTRGIDGHDTGNQPFIYPHESRLSMSITQ